MTGYDWLLGVPQGTVLWLYVEHLLFCAGDPTAHTLKVAILKHIDFSQLKLTFSSFSVLTLLLAGLNPNKRHL